MKELSDGQVEFNSGDIKGPIPVALAAEYFLPQGDRINKAKIVCFGNSSFLMNAYQNYVGNIQLMLNSVGWVSGQDKIQSFNLKVQKEVAVNFATLDKFHFFLLSVLFIPLLSISIGLYRFRRSRYS